jgi:hypothetical protein
MIRKSEMQEQIEVFRDMAIHGPIVRRPDLRAALIAAAVDPWMADLERSAEVARNAVTSNEVILFRRAASDDHPAARLTLWGTDDGYYVPNIVPLETGSLSYSQYNTVLGDFIAHIAAPVVGKFGFTITASAPRQSLDDWISPDTAAKLRRFSGAANKSTGASHPSDERRWFDFVVAVHRAGDKLDAERLARWLHEAEKWDEDSAHKLAGDFENYLRLLVYCDEH